MSRHAYITEYETHGFAVVPGVFTQDEVNGLRGSALTALASAPMLRKAGYGGPPVDFRERAISDGLHARFPAISFWPALLSPFMESLRVDARLSRIVTDILGPDVKQLNNQFYFHLPGDGDCFDWHQDIMFRYPLTDYPGIVEADSYLQTAIIVDQFSTEVAPLYMVPGSFRRGNLGLLDDGEGRPDYPALRQAPDMSYPDAFLGTKPVVLKANPGDVALWCSLTVHASYPGSKDGTRMYYMNGFAAASNASVWPDYMVSGQVVPLDTGKFPPEVRVVADDATPLSATPR